MKLHDFIHAPTRPTWVARMLAYIALLVTLVLVVQVVHFFGWW